MGGQAQRWRFHIAAAACLLLLVGVAAAGGEPRTRRQVVAAAVDESASGPEGPGTSAPGGSDGSSAGSDGTTGEGAAASTTGGTTPGVPPGAKITYDDGADDAVVRVGGSTFLSGPAAVYGQQIAVGYAAGVQYVNDHGGINGRRMVSTIYDDGADPAKMLANTKRLVEIDKVFALGMVGAAVSGEYLAEKGVPVVSEGSLDEDFTNPWWFPLGGPQVTSGMVTAQYFSRVVGVKKVAIFYLDAGANNYSRAYAEKVRGFWEAYGVDASTLVPFAPDQTSCSDAISTARDANVEFIHFELDAGHVIQCGVEAQIQGYKPPKSWGGYLIGVPVIHEALGDFSKGMYAFDAFGANYDNREYQAAIKKISSSTAYYSSVTISSFISVLVTADAMRQLGTNFTRAHLRDVLNTFTRYTPGLTNDPNQPTWTWRPQCHLSLSGGYVIQIKEQPDGELKWEQISPQITKVPIPPGGSPPEKWAGCDAFVPG